MSIRTRVNGGDKGRSNSTEPALEIRQDGTGKILSLKDGDTEVFSVADGGAVTSTGQSLAQDGSAAAPSKSYASDTDLGSYRIGADREGFSAGGVLRWDYNTTRILSTIAYETGALGSAASPSFRITGGGGMYYSSGITFSTDGASVFALRSANGAQVGSGGYLGWSSNADPSAADADTKLMRAAANKIAQRNGTNAQEYNVDGYFVSASSFTTGVVKSVTAPVSVSGATTATSNIIPVGAFVIGVATTTTTEITGASGYQVGDGSDADRWGDITGTAVGTDSDNTDSTANPTGYFAAASAITLTAKTSNFTGGVVQVTVFYLTTGAA